jgi:hypothetical protein
LATQPNNGLQQWFVSFSHTEVLYALRPCCSHGLIRCQSLKENGNCGRFACSGFTGNEYNLPTTSFGGCPGVGHLFEDSISTDERRIGSEKWHSCRHWILRGSAGYMCNKAISPTVKSFDVPRSLDAIMEGTAQFLNA